MTKENFGRIQSEITNFTQLEYRAPEQLDLHSGYPINEKVDSWAIGVVLYQMMYFKMPFESSERENQVEGIVSFPQTDKYTRALQKLTKKLFEPNPRKRPSVRQAFRFIENIQSKLLTTNPTNRPKKSLFSNIDEEEKKDQDYSGDEKRKYKTTQSEMDNNANFAYGKDRNIDTTEKNFEGFGTKSMDTLSNGTRGWVRYATDNSNFPPKIQFLAKLVLKAWKKKDKIYTFYKNLDQRGFGDNTIIALKSL